MINLLIYTNTYYPKIDGISYRIDEFIKRNKDKINITVVTPYQRINNKYENVSLYNNYGEHLKICKNDNSNIYYVPVKNMFNYFKYIKDIIKKHNINRIHVYQGDLTYGIFYYLSEIYNIPLIYSWHTHIHLYGIHYGINKYIIFILSFLLKFLLYNKCDLFYNVSKSSEENLISYNILNTNHKNKKVLPYFINSKIFYPIDYKIKDNNKNDKMKLLYVGRITKEKNLDNLILFIDKYKEQFDLSLIGDGCYLNDIKNKILTMNLQDNIILYGKIDKKKLNYYYNTHDVFVQPSISETMGFVTLEAMATKCCVVGKNACGTKDIISSGKNGLLYNNDEELYNYLLLIKNNKELKEFLQNNAYNDILKYTVDNYCMELLNNITNTKKVKDTKLELVINISFYVLFLFILFIFNL